MRFDWWTGLSEQVQLQIQWSPEHQGERVAFMSIKSGTLKGLVMRCGAANGRFGFFLDWMEDDETIQGNGKEVLPPQTDYCCEKPYKSQRAKIGSKGVVLLTFERRCTSGCIASTDCMICRDEAQARFPRGIMQLAT